MYVANGNYHLLISLSWTCTMLYPSAQRLESVLGHFHAIIDYRGKSDATALSFNIRQSLKVVLPLLQSAFSL
jgi:hypothetical protein